MRWLVTTLCLALLGCAARGPRADAGPDPRLVAADLAWEDRGARGLDPVEDALMRGMRKGHEHDPDYLWRHARMLVARGMAEEDQRRAAIDSYASAREQALHCLDRVPAWRQRRREAGTEAALEVVDETARPCLAWGAFAWARWARLMGGDAVALDLEEIHLMAGALDEAPEAELADLGQWADALVAAIRPRWGSDEDRGRKGLERVVDARPNQLIRRWDLLSLASEGPGSALVQTQYAEIRDRPADTDVDRAVKRWVKEATALPEPEPVRE